MEIQESIKSNRSIIILYTELADYILSCIFELSKSAKVYLVHYPVNKEAPFQFQLSYENIVFFDRSKMSVDELSDLIFKVSPNIIYCAGWSDKGYLKVVKKYKGKIPAFLGFDNNWVGNLKQRLAAFYGRFFISPWFNYAFVPGEGQKQLALKLGFNKSQISTGAYSANLSYFNSQFKTQFQSKEQHFPKRFLYVGRYYEFKGITELWEAFIELQKEEPNEWELWCLGTGDVKPVEHPKIKHFGFVQPSDLHQYTQETGVFVLPSRFEPWGVVVHEFAASGFPLLLSDQVGAKEAFLKEGENGYSFKANHKDSLKAAMKKMIRSQSQTLIQMGGLSHRLAQSISPAIWAEKILNFMK